MLATSAAGMRRDFVLGVLEHDRVRGLFDQQPRMDLAAVGLDDIGQILGVDLLGRLEHRFEQLRRRVLFADLAQVGADRSALACGSGGNCGSARLRPRRRSCGRRRRRPPARESRPDRLRRPSGECAALRAETAQTDRGLRRPDCRVAFGRHFVARPAWKLVRAQPLRQLQRRRWSRPAGGRSPQRARSGEAVVGKLPQASTPLRRGRRPRRPLRLGRSRQVAGSSREPAAVLARRSCSSRGAASVPGRLNAMR